MSLGTSDDVTGRARELTVGAEPAILAAPMGEVDLNALLASPELQAAGLLLLALLLGYAISTALTGVLARAVRRAHVDLDDHLLALARRPVWTTAVLLALGWAGDRLHLDPWQQGIYGGVLGTIGVAVWLLTLIRAADEVLTTLNGRKDSWLSGRASGLVRFAVRLGLLLVATQVLIMVWELDARSLHVSAGVVGAMLAIGAQDSLRDLASGLFAAVDQPLRVGDVVRLDATTRGRVTQIGWRSTRVVTPDGIEVNLPNGPLGDARIVNESGGPSPAIRICCRFPVEHGRTPEEVAAIVLPGASALPEVAADGAPDLRFFAATPAGLVYGLRVWIADPNRLLEAEDAINTHILQALRAAGVRLAYSSHDVGLGGPAAAGLQEGLLRQVASSRS